jgi:hypothetical protein
LRASFISLTAVGFMTACSAPDASIPAADTNPALGASIDSTSPPVGKVVQRSQFADDTIINLVDPNATGGGTAITMTADINPTTVQVYYVGDKTTDSGHTVASPVLVDTLDIPADGTKAHNVNFANPAFAGGYGCILLQSIGSTPSDVFQAYVTHAAGTSGNGAVTFSVGGSVFAGGSYRIPVFATATKVVLALTNQSDFAFEVDISQVSGTGYHSITIEPLSTYKFDSSAYGWTFPRIDSIQIFTTAGGTVSVSGYQNAFNTRYRIAPVKAAPYP